MKTTLLILLFSFFCLSGVAMPVQPDEVVAIEQQTDKEKLTLLTNPVKNGYLQLTFSSTKSNALNVTIINSLGKQVFNARRGVTSEVYSFDVSELSAGIYFLRVNTEHSSFVKKLIIS